MIQILFSHIVAKISKFSSLIKKNMRDITTDKREDKNFVQGHYYNQCQCYISFNNAEIDCLTIGAVSA